MPTDTSAVFITGATGFIGQRLISSLRDAAYSVLTMVRPQRSPDQRIPAFCEQVASDLTDVDKLAAVVVRCTAIIYCAGSVRGRKREDFSTANIDGVRALLAAMERTPRPPPLLLISSLAASRPKLSNYAQSKHAGEQLLLARPTLPWSIFRPPVVYGPGDSEMLPLLKLARRGLLAHAGPPDQRLSLLHVDDLVSAMIAWLSASQNCLHKTYAIDDGRLGGYDWTAIGDTLSGGKHHLLKLPRPLLEIAARINLWSSYLLDYQPMLTPGKVQELIQQDWLCGSNAEFTAATGWQPRISLHTGAQQLFAKVS